MSVLSFTSTVAAPGTPQRLTAGASPTLPTLSGILSGTITPQGRQILVTSDPGNTAAKNLFIGGASLNVAGNSGWSVKIPPGGSATLVYPGNDGTADAGDFFIDTDGATGKYGVEVVG